MDPEQDCAGKWDMDKALAAYARAAAARASVFVFVQRCVFVY